jgi:hypothetical protein
MTVPHMWGELIERRVAQCRYLRQEWKQNLNVVDALRPKKHEKYQLWNAFQSRGAILKAYSLQRPNHSRGAHLNADEKFRSFRSDRGAGLLLRHPFP